MKNQAIIDALKTRLDQNRLKLTTETDPIERKKIKNEIYRDYETLCEQTVLIIENNDVP